jgi:capsid protein
MFTKPLRPSPLVMAMALSAAVLSFPTLSQAAAANTTVKPAVAAVAAKAPSAKPAMKEDRLAMKLSNEGLQAMRAIRLARASIFDGNTQAAGDLLSQASRALNAVDQAAVKETANVQNDLLPIDGQIVVSDSFIDTPLKRQHVGKANEHLKQGQADKARDELRLAEVDASFSRLLMPVDATRRHLNTAETLIKANKYYEANLALKAAEDGLQVDTVAISDIPTPTATR